MKTAAETGLGPASLHPQKTASRTRTQTQEISQERSVNHWSWCNNVAFAGVNLFHCSNSFIHLFSRLEIRRENGTYRNPHINGFIVLLRVEERRGKNDTVRPRQWRNGVLLYLTNVDVEKLYLTDRWRPVASILHLLVTDIYSCSWQL